MKIRANEVVGGERLAFEGTKKQKEQAKDDPLVLSRSEEHSFGFPQRSRVFSRTIRNKRGVGERKRRRGSENAGRRGEKERLWEEERVSQQGTLAIDANGQDSVSGVPLTFFRRLLR
jgi:hypothetical protein